MFGRELTFAVIAFILVIPATVFLSFSLFVSDVFSAPRDPRFDSSSDCKGGVTDAGNPTLTCCWREQVPGSITGEVYCQNCILDENGNAQDCLDPELQMRGLPEGDLPQLETVPPIRTLPGDVGDLPTLEQVPGPGLNQGTEGEPTLPVVCSEEAGLEKDPETGQCVPIEAPVTDEQQPEEPEEEPEEEEQPEPEEEQPSEESDSGDNGNN